MKSLIIFGALIAFSATLAAQTVQAPKPATRDVQSFECKTDDVTADDVTAALTLRGAAENPANDTVLSLSVNGRVVDPATLRHVNMLADGRKVERVTSACPENVLEITIHLAPVPSEKRESITISARGTTVKIA